MLGEPGGGSKVVSKTLMTYRISFRARDEIAEWESYMTGNFDTAGKGKSALIVAAFRVLEARVYGYTEEQAVAAFHDVA